MLSERARRIVTETRLGMEASVYTLDGLVSAAVIEKPWNGTQALKSEYHFQQATKLKPLNLLSYPPGSSGRR
jgi:hypothetical protein